jgi:serine/threonine-protein kinase RsbT
MVETRSSIPITHDSDASLARRRTREFARRQGLTEPETEALATAITEIVRNVLVHAGDGELVLDAAEEPARRGVIATVRDRGPGISDIERAMVDGFSSGGGLGFGLAGAQRLVDEFEIESTVGTGTTVTLRKWSAKDRPR